MRVEEGPSEEMPVTLHGSRTVPRGLAVEMAVSIISIVGNHPRGIVEDCLEQELGVKP